MGNTKIEVNFLKTENKSKDFVDLNKELIVHPLSTFFFRWRDYPNKILIVDRGVTPKNGNRVIYNSNDDLCFGEIEINSGSAYIRDRNRKFQIDEGVTIWGVVTYIINKV